MAARTTVPCSSFELVRLCEAGGAVLDGVGVGGAGVRDLDGQVDDAVAVLGDVVGQEAAVVGARP